MIYRWNHRQLNFSLIELLTVSVVMVAILALLLPAIVSARQKASQTQCLGNLKQLGLAVALYAEDHSGFLPNHNDNNGGSNWTRSMFLCREYYENDFRILRCPDDDEYQPPPDIVNNPVSASSSSSQTKLAQSENSFPFVNGQHFWSYCYNMRMTREWPSSSVPSTVNSSANEVSQETARSEHCQLPRSTDQLRTASNPLAG